MSVQIVLVYQSLLGIYGDRGNGTVLAQRLLRRGIDAEVVVVEPGTELPEDAEVYLLGGGEDGAQTTAVRELTNDGALHRAADRGAVVFGVCAGYQILGNTFTIGEHQQVMPGLGLLDVDTRRGPERAVGEILTRWQGRGGEEQWITGFENHGGFTTLGDNCAPLADVVVGVGNGDGTEGAVQGTVFGTYPHGPVLARNPALADHLLELALGTELDPLPMPEIDRLRAERRKALGH
ncbi:type 1 glutamine amidotransferase [Enemella sp. A6]|uniref:type 1 glutamine amidotransferase n=1 Tax=Enemella sp. A6 TaxID=3440152 RepID=UPI003EBE0614